MISYISKQSLQGNRVPAWLWTRKATLQKVYRPIRRASMIQPKDIEAIKLQKIYVNQLKVKRVGKEVFRVYGYRFGEEYLLFTGYASEVAAFLNDHFK